MVVVSYTLTIILSHILYNYFENVFINLVDIVKFNNFAYNFFYIEPFIVGCGNLTRPLYTFSVFTIPVRLNFLPKEDLCNGKCGNNKKFFFFHIENKFIFIFRLLKINAKT